MTRFDLELIARLCGLHAGLSVDPERAYLVESRLAPVARRAGLGSVEDLMLAIREGEDDDLVGMAVEALSPSGGGFFREPETLGRLMGQVLPALAEARPGEPLRIWCAAAGAGQEAYSLAIAVDERPPGPAGVELLASDLSERAMEKARSGVYSQFEVQMGLSARRLVDGFERAGEAFAVQPRLRQAIHWRRANLMEPQERLGMFDVVVARHLLSALTPAGRGRALANLTAAMRPQGGVLVLGVAEVPPTGLTRMAPGLFAALPRAAVAA